MTTRQRARLTPPAKPKTLAELQRIVPYGPAHVTTLAFSGPWQLQTAKVVLATVRDRNVADYLAMLWNTIAPVAEEVPVPFTGMVGLIEMKSGEPTTVDGKPLHLDMRREPQRRRRLRKGGRGVQVMP